jgi:Ca-activated chloride channel family protein
MSGKALGACPLKNTNVQAEITGFLSRVKVTQEFENNFSEKIEAVYVFPLPQNAAIDDMTMRIGERTVRGKILKREEAREVYEAAKSNGQIASLLDQERPNIFTQAVANILPNEKIIIEISYVETLKYEDGAYEFVFPMVVGPRYIPGSALGKQGSGYAPDTNQVPDASKITPMPAKDRAGHDISIAVKLDAGVSIESLGSKSHEIESARMEANSYTIKLKNEKTIPNKDFILRYDVSGKRIEDAVLTHRGAKGGYFTLILQPPGEVRAQGVTPKEIVFVIDTSGSMSGFPLEKAKEAMKLALDGLNPQDTFNLITFSGDTHLLFEKPVPATPDNLTRAQAFLQSRQGGGGTEMMKAIKAALAPTDSQQHVRVVCFMTDGYVGNDLQIIEEIQKHPNARVFSFGIGQSVNRFLLDKMAEEGRGEVEYVSLNGDGSAAAKRFHERVRSPLLTDISLDFGNLQVADVYPKRINDLFSAKPVVIHGRYIKGSSGVIKLKGKTFGRETVREIVVNFPENELNHDVLATLWARTRIDDLMRQDYAGVQNGNTKPEVKDTITNLGLEYRLLTQFTSFVAVEERIVTDGGQPRKIEVPVEIPEGVSREGVFGSETVNVSSNAVTVSQIQALPVNSRQFGSLMTVTAGRRNDRKRTRNITTNSIANVSKVELSKKDDNELITIDGAESDSPIILQGIKAVTLPKPEQPQNVKADSAINVEVTLDASGKVVSAKAISGDKSFYLTTETAAKNAKFELPKVPFEIAKVTGAIVYNFAKDKTVAVAPELQNVRVEIKPNKYQCLIKALVTRLKNKQTNPKTDEAKFVKNGKAEIIVRVKELKTETVAELRKLGFEVLTEMNSANAVVGRIAIEKIATLAELDLVTFISPQNR